MNCEHWNCGACHSCTHIEVPYPTQIARKQSRVEAALALVPGSESIEWLDACASSPAGFRTNAKLVVGGTRRRPTLGILGPDRRGVDLPGCPIQYPAINAATPGLKRLIRALDLEPYDVPTKRGELKNILITVGAEDRLMVRFVLRSRDRVADLRRALPLLRELVPAADVVTANIHPTHEAIVEGPDEIILSKNKTLPMTMNGLTMHVGPRSFVQTNAEVAAELYRQAAAWAAADDPRSLWDLYCGVGGFALHASAAGVDHVTGVEVSEGAISAAITAARESGLGRGAARFIAADATQWAHNQALEDLSDVVVVNPPRRGIGAELAQWLEDSNVHTVIYSSCNPATLAKDLAAMPSLKPTQGRLFDMFPHTVHAEVAVLLERS
ncbi:methyltransferase domain-containing protein [Schaalia vaccimaxillae]|uniref:methyltransferase domain-containing protein n=1 Tax=Schaalia vaccimaxillae TaxID=183916 RepID=UPI00047D55BA|nr:methyltransferase domain-containing protein [Schaalia vaccimaxillae]